MIVIAGGSVFFDRSPQRCFFYVEIESVYQWLGLGVDCTAGVGGSAVHILRHDDDAIFSRRRTDSIAAAQRVDSLFVDFPARQIRPGNGAVVIWVKDDESLSQRFAINKDFAGDGVERWAAAAGEGQESEKRRQLR